MTSVNPGQGPQVNRTVAAHAPQIARVGGIPQLNGYAATTVGQASKSGLLSTSLFEALGIA